MNVVRVEISSSLPTETNKQQNPPKQGEGEGEIGEGEGEVEEGEKESTLKADKMYYKILH